MNEQATPVVTLDYAGPLSMRTSRWAAWVRRLPTWVVALGLMLMLLALNQSRLQRWLDIVDSWALYHLKDGLYFVVLFAAGATSRLNWRHLLVMVPLAAAAYALDEVPNWLPELPYPYSRLVWPTWAILLIALGEWVLLSWRSGFKVACVVIAAVATACLFRLLLEPLGYAGSKIPLSNNWNYYIHWLLLTTLAWAAIPTALQLDRQAGRRRLRAAAGVAGAAIGSFLLFFHVLVYPVAHYSLVHGGPFDPPTSASLLALRGSVSDRQALWEAMDKVDWSQPWDGSWDLRWACVAALAELDRPATAARVSAMLLERPSPALASCAAGTLAAEGRYETVAILLRFALRNAPECLSALEAMKVPHAITVNLWQEAAWNSPRPGEDFQLDPQTHQRLVSLLGRDAGPNLSDWASLDIAGVDGMSTPLSQAQTEEADRVLAIFEAYGVAIQQRLSGEALLFQRRMRLAGFTESDMERIRSELRRGPAWTVAPLGADEYARQAHEEMQVPPPDWSVRTTDELAAEVDRYAQRVQAVLKEREAMSESLPDGAAENEAPQP